MAIGMEKRKQIQEQRREQILDVACQLFDKNGYSETRIIDIANVAGISKGLVYNYFSSKEDILYAFTDSMNECLDELNQYDSPRAAMKEFAVRLLSPLEQTGYIPPLRIFITVDIKNEIKNPKRPNPASEYFGAEYFENLIKKGQALGEFKQGDSKLFADIYWKYLLGCLIGYLNKDDQNYVLPNIDEVLLFLDRE